MKAIADYPTTSTDPLPPDAMSFSYQVKVNLWLTRDDVDLLIELALSSYDSVCRAMALRRGQHSPRTKVPADQNGMLTILRDMYLGDSGEGDRTVATLSSREIDTMLKILEMASLWGKEDVTAPLRRRLYRAFQAINEESKRLREEQESHCPDL